MAQGYHQGHQGYGVSSIPCHFPAFKGLYHPLLRPSECVSEVFFLWYPQSFPSDLPHTDVGGRQGVDGEEEEDGDEVDRWSMCDSQDSTSTAPTSPSTSERSFVTTTSTGSEYYDMEWAYDQDLDDRVLEELREGFEAELEDPSAWTLQRIMVLADASQFAARETVKMWLGDVAKSTDSAAGEPLRLPKMERPRESPFLRLRTWKEADALVGEEREICFGRDVEDADKRIARSTILFLFPQVKSTGLTPNDKENIFAVASLVWSFDTVKAKALLWVLENEYSGTDEKGATDRDWANFKTEEFMFYTALFPPPIVLTR